MFYIFQKWLYSKEVLKQRRLYPVYNQKEQKKHKLENKEQKFLFFVCFLFINAYR